jgi:hypothetical protein
MLLLGCQQAPAAASAGARAAAAPPPLKAWRARVGRASARAHHAPAAPPPRRRRRFPCSPPRAAPSAGTGGLPADATVEDLLAALGNLSSGSDSDADFGAGGAGGGLAERVVLPCGTVDYYALLQVDDDAPPQAIKRAYRGLARECHPDYR